MLNTLWATKHTATTTTNSHTALDFIIVNLNDVVTNHWKTNIPFIDDHDLLTANIQSSVYKPPVEDFTFRDYNSTDKTGLLNCLRTCDWDICSVEAPLEGHLDWLYTHLNDAIALHVPVKTIRQGKKRQPWFTSEYDRLIVERDRLHRRYRCTRLQIDLQMYRQARDHAYNTIESAKLRYYHDRLVRLSEPEQIWKELGNLGIFSSNANAKNPFKAEDLNCHFDGVAFERS